MIHRHSTRQSERHGEFSGVLDGDEHSAVFHERREIVDALPGRVRGVCRRSRRCPGWESARSSSTASDFATSEAGDDRLRTATGRRKKNHIVFRVEVGILRRVLNADVRRYGMCRKSNACRHQPSVWVLSQVCMMATRGARAGCAGTDGAAKRVRLEPQVARRLVEISGAHPSNDERAARRTCDPRRRTAVRRSGNPRP